MSEAPSAVPEPATFFTPDDVAKRFAVSRSMIYALVKRGELGATWIGRLPRISEDDIVKYLARARGLR
jgi:excisionase family DNA binding protein